MNQLYKILEEKKISMIFQEPMTSLKSLHNIEKQITECFSNQKSNKSKCINLLKEVGIENPEKDYLTILINYLEGKDKE